MILRWWWPLRCSNKNSPCQVPSINCLSSKGIDTLVCVNIDFMWAGISSGPSLVCVNRLLFSGTRRFIQLIKSVCTEGSAFSWMIRLAEVCWMNKVNNPLLVSTCDNKDCAWWLISISCWWCVSILKECNMVICRCKKWNILAGDSDENSIKKAIRISRCCY